MGYFEDIGYFACDLDSVTKLIALALIYQRLRHGKLRNAKYHSFVLDKDVNIDEQLKSIETEVTQIINETPQITQHLTDISIRHLNYKLPKVYNYVFGSQESEHMPITWSLKKKEKGEPEVFRSSELETEKTTHFMMDIQRLLFDLNNGQLPFNWDANSI